MGWARVCGWGANDETTSTVSQTVEGERTVTGETRNTGFSHIIWVHVMCVSLIETASRSFFISEINLRLLSSMSQRRTATDSDGLDYQKAIVWFKCPRCRICEWIGRKVVNRFNAWLKEKQPPFSSQVPQNPVHSAPQSAFTGFPFFSLHGWNIRCRHNVD